MDREADPDPTRRQAAGNGRLDALERDPADDRPIELRKRLGQPSIHGPDRGIVGREVQEPGRLVGQPEAEVGGRQVAIKPQGLAIQVGEDRVERVLDDPGVRARRP